MTTLATMLGVALIGVALRDIFAQLFQPSGSGPLNRWLTHLVWDGLRRIAVRYPGVLSLAGPSIFLIIIGTWVALLAAGWAFIMWPRLPEDFFFATGGDPSEEHGFVDALYVSLLTLTTLGYGNITPTVGWLRIIVVLEALVGFGLLTAVISWLLSIYPALSRRQALAREVSHIRRAENETGADATRVDSEAAERLLFSLTSQLIMVRGDLAQFPVTYYFRASEELSSLPANMPGLVHLAERGHGEDQPPAVRLRAAMLQGAIQDFADTVSSRNFLGISPESVDDALAVYARDHLHAPSDEQEPPKK